MTRAELIEKLLQRYINAYPAFRIKPEGAPNSPKRIEQEHLMALEDEALAALKAQEKVGGQEEGK